MRDRSAWPARPPLLADGAIGDWLRLRGLAAGLAPGVPPAALNLERPQSVTAGHRAFRQAGAALHRTNTRHANSLDLGAHGLAGRCEAINNSGAAALRQAIGTGAVMAGSIAPIRAAGASRAERERAYGEQVIYLSDTGCDLLVLEHFTTVEEAALVLRAIRNASGAPALALLTFDRQGRTAEGLAAAEAGRALLAVGAEALGVSCTPGGAALTAIVEALRPLGAPLGVLLSLPALEAAPGERSLGGDDAPRRFAETLAALAAPATLSGTGVAIVGGCCGVLPAHIRAAARRLGKATD